ncbi:MAG TPA: hypothetical protein VF543_00330 [Pyrinomonadaceae bacterium]|jgi:hypothetical protein
MKTDARSTLEKLKAVTKSFQTTRHTRLAKVLYNYKPLSANTFLHTPLVPVDALTTQQPLCHFVPKLTTAPSRVYDGKPHDCCPYAGAAKLVYDVPKFSPG